jgi:hypothetical protein
MVKGKNDKAPLTKVDNKSKDIKKVEKKSPTKATPKKNGTVAQEEVKNEQVELKNQWDYFQLDAKYQ